MGYGLEFWWLATANVTFQPQATEICSHIPLRQNASRFCSFASLNPQKFDFGRHSCLPSLRMTYRNKQIGDPMYYVYILASKANAMLYIGVTNNLARRLREHKNGEIDGFTKTYGIHKLVFFEEFTDINDAIACEKRLKRWTRAKKNALVESKNPNWDDWSDGFI